MIKEGVAYDSGMVFEIDPRVKIIAVFLFSCLIAVSSRFIVLGMALFFAAGAVALARVPVKDLAKRLTTVNVFILFLWVFLPFSVPGESIYTIAGLGITHEGIVYATQITVKSNTIMMALIVLIHSTSILTLGHALHELRVPPKIVHLFFFTYRYIHVIYREYIRLLNAMKVRAFRAGTNMHTYRTFAHMVGMLLVRSADRGERVHRAMICRGFSGRFYSLKTFTFKATDLWVLLFSLALVATLGLLEWTTIL
jgi:cobalt/nickel transport system permease protein